MVSDDYGNFTVVLNVGKDPLPNGRVLLHLGALFRHKSPGLFEQAGRQSDLADVVYQAAQVKRPCSAVDQPNSAAMSRAYIATASEWPAVYRSRASSVATSAIANERFALSRRTFAASSDVNASCCFLETAKSRCAAIAGTKNNAAANGVSEMYAYASIAAVAP